MNESPAPHEVPISLRHELIAEGYHDRAIARLVTRGVLAKPRRGAYVDAAVWSRLDAAARHAVTARAVLRQARTEVVLSHVSALPEYDAPTWNLDLANVHITRTDRKAGRKEAGIQQHRGALLPEDVVKRNNVKVTSATRLALDITTVAGAEESLVVVNHLLHSGATTEEALAERYRLMDCWPGTLVTDLVLRLADGRIESVGETRTFYLLYRQGVPMPVPQYEIRDQTGRLIGRVDFAWPELGVFLEFDGKVKYSKFLREGESVADAVVREKRREERIREITGWRCVRLVWADLYTPEATAARVRSMLFPVADVA